MEIKLNNVYQNGLLIIKCTALYEIKGIYAKIEININDNLYNNSKAIFFPEKKINLFDLKYKIALKALGYNLFSELSEIEIDFPDLTNLENINDKWLRNCFAYYSKTTKNQRDETFHSFANLIQSNNEIDAIKKLISSKSNIAQEYLLRKITKGYSNNFKDIYNYLLTITTNEWLLNRVLLNTTTYGFHRYLILKNLTRKRNDKTKELLIYHIKKIQDQSILLTSNIHRDQCLDYREVQITLEYLSYYNEDQIKWIFEKEFLNKYSNCSKVICRTLSEQYKIPIADIIFKSYNSLLDKTKNYVYDSAIENLSHYSNFKLPIKGDEILDIFLRSKQLNYAGSDNLYSKYLTYVIQNYNHSVPNKLFSIIEYSNNFHKVRMAIRMLNEIIVISSNKIKLRVTPKRVKLLISKLYYNDSGSLNFTTLKCLSLLSILKNNKTAKKTIIEIAENDKESILNRAFAFNELNFYINYFGNDEKLSKLYKKNLHTNDDYLKVKIIKGLLLLDSKQNSEILKKEIDSINEDCYKSYLDFDFNLLEKAQIGIMDYHNISSDQRKTKKVGVLQSAWYFINGMY